MFSCKKCHSTFQRPDSLRRHNKSCVLGIRHLCCLCSLTFSYKTNLTKHKRNVHNIYNNNQQFELSEVVPSYTTSDIPLILASVEDKGKDDCTVKPGIEDEQCLKSKIQHIKVEPDIPRESNDEMIEEEVKGELIVKHEDMDTLVHESDKQQDEITQQFPNFTSSQIKNNLIEATFEEIHSEYDTQVEDQSFINSKRFKKNNDESTNNTSFNKESYSCFYENSQEDINDPDKSFLLSLLPQIKQIPSNKKTQLYICILKSVQEFTH